MGQILDLDAARQVTALGKVLLKDADELADEMADSIRAAVPIYRRADIVTTEQLRQASRANVEVIFTELGGEPATSSARSYDNGRARARAGVPLTAVMAAYRVAAAFLWEKLADVAGNSALAPRSLLPRPPRCGWSSTRSPLRWLRRLSRRDHRPRHLR